MNMKQLLYHASGTLCWALSMSIKGHFASHYKRALSLLETDSTIYTFAYAGEGAVELQRRPHLHPVVRV